MVRVVKWAISAAVVQGLLLLLLSWMLSGFDLASSWAALLLGLLMAVTTGLLWPLMSWVLGRLPALLFPIVFFALTGVMLLLVAALANAIEQDSVTIDSVGVGIVVALGLTVGNTLLGVLFGLDDQRMYDRYVTDPIRRRNRGGAKSDVPGVVFIEIDGLSQPVLDHAIEAGYMPTVRRWLESGSHELRGWEPDLSSQTSASQAGILLGSNEGIPAFRWWDKPAGALMVSSKRATARALEERLSTGDGLLAGGGASRWNVFSGDAADCLGTYSQIGRGATGGHRSYYAYLANPYSLARTVTLFITDIVRELVEATRQRMTNVQPRIHRGFKYAFIRAGTTVLLQEASAFMLTADMYRGVPSIYSTFFAYDEVAHHSGIDRTDSLKVLRTLDKVIAHLERVAADAPRPYHLVVLSDHGQSQGFTFLQRYGKTLGDVVRELIDAPGSVMTLESGDDGLVGIDSALTEAIRHDSRSMRVVRRVIRDRVSDGQVSLQQDDDSVTGTTDGAATTPDTIVVASGNLGLISFPRFSERLTYEQLAESFPGLVQGLAEHPGISFVMARSAIEGGLVIGSRGIHYLSDSHVAGEDPLASFGPNAAQHLSRTDAFANAPDILVMSMFDPATGEVAAFEELVGCHGGLGGPQTTPFVLFPAGLADDHAEPIIGAASLHHLIKSWTPSVASSEVVASRA